MMKIIDKIFQPEHPIPPMKFSRRPVLHLFWAGGLVAMAFGFFLGFLLWMMQTGILETLDDYLTIRLLHGRIQIIGFAGSFLLGFALQAGPHVVGGNPPTFGHVISFVPALWLGLLLGVFPSPIASISGNLLLSFVFVGPSYLLFRITLGGDPQLRFSRGIPLSAAFLILAASPWMALDDPEKVLFVLWCGPMTIAMVAGQQLINNVMKGDKLVGRKALVFLALLLVAWLTTGMTAFTHLFSWAIPGWAWLMVLVMLTWGTRFISAVKEFGFASISVTLSLGLAGMMVAAAIMAVMNQEMPLDAVVHILGAGIITLLILGVVSRVVGFFSGGAVFSDLAVSIAILIWSAVATLRVTTSIGADVGVELVLSGVILGGILLTVWGVRVAWRLYEISTRPYPGRNG